MVVVELEDVNGNDNYAEVMYLAVAALNDVEDGDKQKYYSVLTLQVTEDVIDGRAVNDELVVELI
jgi:predicted DNA-binding protein